MPKGLYVKCKSCKSPVLADSGQVNILAAVSSNKDEHVVPCIEVLNTYFNRPDIPVGAPKSEGGVSLTTWHKTKWTEELPARYPHKTAKTSDASDAVKVYRRILSTQPDSSVVVCTIGFFTNLKDLLLSGGDEYSPLSGCDLVAKKVKRVVSMAGLFPEGKEFNEAEDPDLYNPRDTRDVIIGHILEDLDYAYTNILEEDVTHNSTIVNKWTAAAFKSRVCLFEAAWRKYHAADQLDIARTGCTEYSAKDLYKLAAEAAKEVMDNGPYKLYTSGAYSDGRGAYRELFIADKAVTTEVMMAIETDKVLGLGEQNWWYNSSTYGPHLCMSRKFMLSYLNADGTPYVEKKADGSYKNFVEETTGRDTRLNQTIRGALLRLLMLKTAPATKEATAFGSKTLRCRALARSRLKMLIRWRC